MKPSNTIWPARVDNVGRIVSPRWEPETSVFGGDGTTAVVFVAWNALELTQHCLERVVAYTDPAKAMLVIVDNGSDEPGMVKMLGEVLSKWEGDFRFLRFSKNQYYSKGFNAGIRAVPGNVSYVVLCSSDCEPKSKNWLKYYIDALGDFGDAAGELRTEQIQPFQMDVWEDLPIVYPESPGLIFNGIYDIIRLGLKYEHLYQYSCIFRRSSLQDLGLYLDTGRFYQYHSDWELSLRMGALGYKKVFVTPDVHHHHSIAGLWVDRCDLYNEYIELLKRPELDGEQLAKERMRIQRELESAFFEVNNG